MSALRRLAVTIGIATGLALTLAPAWLEAGPITLEAIHSVLEVGSRPGFVNIVDFPRAELISRSNGEQFATGSSWRSEVFARTRSNPPSAFASSLSESRGVVGSNGLIVGGGYPSFARSTFEYQVVIDQTATLPTGAPASLPLPTTVKATMRAFASIDGEVASNAASAFGYAVIAGIFSPRVVAHAPALSFAVDERLFSLDFALTSDTIIEVVLFGEARTVASAGPFGLTTVFSKAEAFIDPVFAFNQAAFDDYARAQGFATFDLSQYYAFRFSPGIGQDTPIEPIPEPATLALLLAGLGGLAVRKRRRVHRINNADGHHLGRARRKGSAASATTPARTASARPRCVL